MDLFLQEIRQYYGHQVFFIYWSKHTLEASMLHGGIEDKGGDCLQTLTLGVSKDQEFNVSFFVARLSLQTFTYAPLKI